MTKIIRFNEGIEKLSYSTLIAKYYISDLYADELHKRVELLIKNENERTRKKIKKRGRRK